MEFSRTKRYSPFKISIILGQEQGWFDQNNAFEFATKVQAQLEQVEQGIGDKLGNIFMSIAQCVTGFIIAFITLFYRIISIFTSVKLINIFLTIIW